VHSDMHTRKQFLQLTVGLGLGSGLLFMSCCHFVLVLFAFVVLGLVSSVLSQDIGSEERL